MTARTRIQCDGPCGGDLTDAPRSLQVFVSATGGVMVPNTTGRQLHYCPACFEPVGRVLGVAVERWYELRAKAAEAPAPVAAPAVDLSKRKP